MTFFIQCEKKRNHWVANNDIFAGKEGKRQGGKRKKERKAKGGTVSEGEKQNSDAERERERGSRC